MCKEYTQNRELSWLKFNERVLMEAAAEDVPLLERLKFVSIFTSNLDEFFMIRVGSLSEVLQLKDNPVDNKSGMNTKEQLNAIYQNVRQLYKKKEKIFRTLEMQLRVHGICCVNYKELDSRERKWVNKYYHEYIAPVLSPQIVDEHHPFPHLANNAVHVGTMVFADGKEVFGVIPIPAILPSMLFIEGADVKYIPMEDIINAHLEEIFENYEIRERVNFRVTRNADINVDDEAFDFGYDFRKKMKKVIKQRRRMGAVRLELSSKISAKFYAYMTEKIGVSSEQVYYTKIPFKMDYAFSLSEHLPADKAKALTYSFFKPQANPEVDMNSSIIRQIEKKDILLSLPFESLNPFIHLLKEASEDPDVISIKITIYRLARQAKVVEYLCNAAENGKDVTVIIELRARFDEQNNIDWSERLEDAGCNVIYGFEEYKVHSKICLITKKEKNRIRHITQIGTGNYNEKTAKQYTDLSLMTADEKIGNDAVNFFRNMAIGNLNGKYEYLLVSPNALKDSVIGYINKEIEKGSEGRIVLKLNSITDIDIIEKLKQASCAGVKIEMIVRGICCILPGIPEKTDNIHIRSIVGRYLEHSRIYVFGSGENEKMFISSADFMTRNTERRVEVACPVLDEAIKKKIHHLLEACLADNVKGRILLPDASYTEIPPSPEEKRIDCQQLLMTEAEQNAAFRSVEKKDGKFIRAIRRWFR